MDCEHVIVKISNWDKHNPRKEYKRPVWFAFDNRMLEDDKFYDFTAEELKSWVYILSKASQNNTDSPLISFAHASRVCRIKGSVLQRSLEKLQKLGVITYVPRTSHDRETTGNVQATVSTKQTNTQDNTKQTRPNAEAFDLGLIFSEFPKREGETKGLKELKKQIKTQKDLEDAITAAKNYSHHCRTKNVEEKFISKFHNWVAEWRDWISPQTGKVKFKRPADALPPNPEQPIAPISLTAEEKAKIKKTFGDKFNDKLGETGA